MSAINSSHPKKNHHQHQHHQHHYQHCHHRHRLHTMSRLQRQVSNALFMTASSRSTIQQAQSHSRSSSQIYPATDRSDNDNDNNDYQPNNNDNLSYQQWLVNVSL
ncbi:hypothetical protein LOAG_03750 [Loa loa]|uniref:Uncharacterized protein n=1 Tax=Loa loa TaxID=7209 RepID=A0A1S0U472_LOALO|nr:hypothetical protein LOAG_03750 [Loa loa]EFO24736.1 hypothetical protein LOAG_03750 [Loa loa]